MAIPRETFTYNSYKRIFDNIKQPDEKFYIKVDYTDSLETAEVLDDANCSVAAYDEEGDEYAALIDIPTLDYQDKFMTFRIKDGVSGTVYFIKTKAQSDDGNIFEMDLRLKVEEIGQ